MCSNYLTNCTGKTASARGNPTEHTRTVQKMTAPNCKAPKVIACSSTRIKRIREGRGGERRERRRGEQRGNRGGRSVREEGENEEWW